MATELKVRKRALSQNGYGATKTLRNSRTLPRPKRFLYQSPYRKLRELNFNSRELNVTKNWLQYQDFYILRFLQVSLLNSGGYTKLRPSFGRGWHVSLGLGI